MKRLFLLFLLPLTLFATTLHEHKIKEILHQKFQATYPQMQINAVYVNAVSTLPKRLTDYRVTAVAITRDNLRRAKGSVMVTFAKGEKVRKTYYKYKIDATIPLYKSNANIPKGRTITPDVAVLTEIPFTTLYHKPLGDADFYHYAAKRRIKEGDVLSFEKVSRATDIQRNEKVTAIIREGALQLQFEAKAMQSGNVGDIIKIKKDYKKSFKARIISNTTVEVVE